MKKTTRKISFILILLFAFASSIYFFIQAYKSYQYHQVAQKSDLYLALADELDTVVQNIEEEKLFSALYLGYNGQTNFNQLAVKREQSDTAIKQAEQYLKNNMNFPDILQQLQNITKDLQYVRSRVDVINNDYNTILFSYYHEKINQPLLQTIKSLLDILSSGIPEEKPYLDAYSGFALFRDNLSMEQSYLSLILSKSRNIPAQDLALWEKILQEEKIPDLSALQNKSLQTQLRSIFQPEKLKEQLFNIRVGVLRGVNSGQYAIAQSACTMQISQILKRIIKVEKNIELYLQSIDLKNRVPMTFYSNLFLAVIALIIFLILLFQHKKLSRSKVRKSVSSGEDIQIKHKLKLTPRAEKESVQEFTPPSKEMPATLARYDNTDDLPLTNIKPKQKEIEKEKIPEPEIIKIDEALRKRDSEEITFEPIQLFKELIKPCIETADKKKIIFHYAIDPSLPQICIGDRNKIKEILTLFLEYAMNITPAHKNVTFQVENVAQKEFDTAISFIIKDSGRHFDQEERRAIKRGSSTKNKLAQAFSPQQAKLIHAGALVAKLDGSLQVENITDEGTQFTISLNLKKYISTDT